MIAFDLACSRGHTFEGWFDSTEEFERQKASGLVNCPVCGDEQVAKQLSPVRAMKVGGDQPEKDDALDPAKLQAMFKAFSRYIDRNFENVGQNFAKEALKMHYGVTPNRNIRGVSTVEEEKMLNDEGIVYFKAPMVKEGN